MKILSVIPLALAVTFTSVAFADTPKKDAPADKGGAAKDSKDPKGAPKTAPKDPPKDTGKSDTKPPAAK
jgi:hypothetical protein